MNKRLLPIILFLSALVLASLACGASVSTANMPSAYLTADENGGGQTSEFTSGQTFYAIAKLANAPDDTKVKAVWYAVAVDGVDPNTQLDSAEMTGGDQTLTFKLTNSNLWPEGKYKVELYLNDKLDKTLEFSVKG